MSNEATNILMIEDNPGDARLIRELLSEGEATMFTLEWVDRLSTGLKRLSEGGIDLILLDLGLPDSQGFDTITRTCNQTHCVPIVVLTGHADEMLAIRAMREGAQDYLIKGQIDGNSLIRAMRYAIERNRLEKVVQKAHEELEQRIVELKESTEKLRVAKEVAEVANIAKSNFLASMSHEMRTPLNAIIGFSEILRDKYFGELNEKQADYIQDILGSGKHLLALISDILDLAQIEADKLELELSRVNIKDLLKNSLVMIREKAKDHRISLDTHIPEELSDLKIQVDKRKLKQIMFNLLLNAAKFTPDGGAITVEADQKGEEIIISVKDTGIGIAPEDKEKIFDAFYQVKGGMRDKTPGTGLGLSLTKSLVEMHEGRIWVESEGEGKGSTFSFVIPVT